MTTFSYSTGNPANLTGGATASMNDISGPFTDLRTFLNGANIDDTQMVSPTNPVWRPILTASGFVTNVLSGTSYWFTSRSDVIASGSNSAFGPPLWLPSTAADVAVAGKTTRLRLRTVLAVNATAPGVTITPALYLVTAIAGPAGNINLTLGAAAMTTPFVTPLASTAAAAVSSTVDLSSLNATAAYCFGVAVSGGTAAGSCMPVQMTLEMRHT